LRLNPGVTGIIMALLEKNLVVKRSTLPHAGMGLFTRKFIPKGTRIVEYKGRVGTWQDVSRNGHSSRYISYVKRGHVIDAEPYKKAIARFANDAGGLIRRKGLNNNAFYEQDGLRIFITAKKDIEAGSEILVGYGKEYWDAVRFNNRISQKEKINGS
jgi:SET domain-containing protein